MQQGQQYSQDGHGQRAEQGHELEHSGNQSEYERAGQIEKGKAHTAKAGNQQTSRQLRADISCQGAVYVLKQLVAAPTQTATRQHRQSRSSEAVGILQKEKTQNRNQHQPGDEDDQPQRSFEGRAGEFAAPGD